MSLSTMDAEYLRAVVMRNSGNHVDPGRDYLFESRLQQLLRNCGLQSLNELVSALRTDGGRTLQRSVAEAMTINETSFFRDTPTFDLLRTELLKIRTAEGPALTSRYALVVYATTMAMIALVVTVVLNQPAPGIVYKAF